MDLVSIITVNYNGVKDTHELVNSLAQYELFPYELIIVDNGSKQNEASILREYLIEPVKQGRIKILRSEKNLGFAGGNNLGLKEVTGNFILFLNNDIIIDHPFLEKMINCFKKNAKVGLVSPKIRYEQQREYIQYAGFTPLSAITLRNKIIGTCEIDKGQYNTSHSTSYAHGACMMTTRDILIKVGTMSEVYFLFYEELDWSQRIKDAGYLIWYCPSAYVYHKEGMSIEKGTPLRLFYLNRGRMLYARRNYKGITKFLSCFYQLTIVMPKNIGKAILHKEWKNAEAFWEAGIHGLFDSKGEN